VGPGMSDAVKATKEGQLVLGGSHTSAGAESWNDCLAMGDRQASSVDVPNGVSNTSTVCERAWVENECRRGSGGDGQ
jgi:hypothetical protein